MSRENAQFMGFMTFRTQDVISYDLGRRASWPTALKTPGEGLPLIQSTEDT